jgi:hypothetical protein
MTNRLMRGSAPNRAQPDYARPGSFKPGRQKQGGRKPGTPNVFSIDYKKAIIEAAWRIGEDGNGKDGIVGYFKWVALHHTAVFLSPLLINLLLLEFAERNTPEEPHRTTEEIDQHFRDYIGLTGKNRAETETGQVGSRSQWDWTGQPFPVGTLMQVAVQNPKEFCTLIAAAFLRPPTKRHGLAGPRP